jgi:hypothetical protein
MKNANTTRGHQQQTMQLHLISTHDWCTVIRSKKANAPQA